MTELVISELLWLNYSAPEKPVYLYINSTGEGRSQPETPPVASVALLPGNPFHCACPRVTLISASWLPLTYPRRIPVLPSSRLRGTRLRTGPALSSCRHTRTPLLPAGSQTLQGEAVGFETEATAIMDTMAYIRPDIYTLASVVAGQLLASLCLRNLCRRVSLHQEALSGEPAAVWLGADCPACWFRLSALSMELPAAEAVCTCRRCPCRSLARPLATPP